ncbi:elongation factor G [Aminithiophilus ramosus]|uniref:Elongation factor G n=1 Tax=Aminithiophilus ramosus TaxID=3029084 RepID=A0A9Q7EW86_9BACT|nr:elongation factor G [Aminithiophilus ramosus]QTX33068.1 elongation factor G [Aminithiophilus ramosus]
MGTRKPEDIRSIAIAAHGGAGKTSLTEAMLFNTGAVTRMGKIEDGNTVSDFTPEEQKRQISINTSLATLTYRGKTVYALDTPGFSDFVGELRSAMRVADGAAIVVSGVHGVEVQTEKAWEFADEFGRPTVFFVSKMDKENADFGKTVENIQEALTANALPVLLPIGQEASFKGVVDVLTGKAYTYRGNGGKDFTVGEMPADMADAVAAAREALVERAVEVDDEAMMRYLDGETLQDEEIAALLRRSVVECRLFPVVPGAGPANVGITQFLDVVVDLLPSPLETAPRPALRGEEEVLVAPDPKGPFYALCFKVMVDPYVGKLSFIRVVSGGHSTDTTVFNVNRGEEERVSVYKLMTGKNGVDSKDVVVGDIVAVPKLVSAAVGDTLAAKGASLILPPIKFPRPIYSLAVSPKTRADLDKLASAVRKILDEDMTLQFDKNAETGDNVLSGMGDVHLDIVLARVKERYGVDLEVATPAVPYRETIRKPAKAQGKHKKQTGGHGQYGDVHIEFSPLGKDEGFVFEDKIVGGSVPKNFIPAVEKGLREVKNKGVLAGFPVVDFKASLFFGSYHDVDSSEMAFKLAAHLAFKKGIAEASPVLLEPIMNVEVVVPEEYLGDVMGDFNSRRGRIMGIDSKGRLQIVKAQVPLAEMFRYAIILRSMTSGRGNFTMSYSHYEDVPGDISKKVIAARKVEEEEE